jgi:hypothetical protein
MRRGEFVQSVGGAVIALRFLKAPPAVPAELPAVLEPAAPASLYEALSVPLSASGGLCAPLTPIYAIPSLDARPVRDALPRFSAARG